MTAATATDEVRVPLLVGGEPLETGNWLDVMDPAAPSRVVGRAALASESEARRALHAAHTASEQWGALEPERRAEILLAALGALEADRAQNAEILVRENGKIKREAEVDLAVFSHRCRLAAGLAGQLSERLRLPHKPDAKLAPSAPPFRSEVTQL